ncbi:hypothetical protein A7982_12405 [Minicystis rosea]|nr:hypothetical protein A7982_12405 [Minicystis rosea]
MHVPFDAASPSSDADQRARHARAASVILEHARNVGKNGIARSARAEQSGGPDELC